MSYAGIVRTSAGDNPIGSTLYGVCDTGASTAAKTVTLSNFDELIEGVTIHIKFTNTNTASSPTLNVNSTGAKAIMKYGTTGTPGTTAASSWAANSVLSLTYDGTYWRINDVGAEDAIYNSLDGKISTEATNRANAVTAALQKLAIAYSSSSTYAIGDIVTYNDGLYCCNTDIPTAEVWTAAHWTAITVNEKFSRRLQFTDTVVDKDDFAEDESNNGQPAHEDYPYVAAAALTGVTASMVAEVIFSVEDAAFGRFAPAVETYDGGIYIYADSKPEEDLTIPTILVWR